MSLNIPPIVCKTERREEESAVLVSRQRVLEIVEQIMNEIISDRESSAIFDRVISRLDTSEESFRPEYGIQGNEAA